MKLCPTCDTTYPNEHITCDQDGAVLIASGELDPGTVIRNKYRIVRVLGKGGMGTVYLAEHMLLGRLRALKFISGEMSRDPRLLKRFRQEAQAAIQLRHPNVVEVLDLDQGEDGSPYIAMEYVEGSDLRNAMDHGPLPVERALAIASGVAQGLAVAHANGIIHRDVKPENVLLTRGVPETPKLLDFGIAAVKQTATSLSRTRGLMLTPEYAAPEQWKGIPAEQLDGRVDLYALGGVFYELLTGRTCFHSHTTEGWMYQHLQQQPQAPSIVRPELAQWAGLDELVLRLLARDPAHRPASAEDVLRSLGQIRKLPAVIPPAQRKDTALEQPKAETPASRQPGKEKLWSQKPAIWLGGGVVALLLLVAGYFLSTGVLRQKPPSTVARVEPQATAPVVPQPATSKPYQAPRTTPDHKAEKPKPQSPATSSTPVARAPQTDKQQAPAGKNGGDTPATSTQAETQAPASAPQKSSSSAAQTTAQAKALLKEKKFADAFPLFQQACTAGEQEACMNVGWMYIMGNGVTADPDRGVSIFSKACDAGKSDGCVNLGLFYRLTGNAQQASTAASAFSKACNLGNAEGCENLGRFYRVGWGVERDPEKAKQLLDKACTMGDSAACDLAKTMH